MAAAAVAQSTAAMEALADLLVVDMEAPALEVVPADGQALEDPAMEAVEDQATEASAMAAQGDGPALECPAMEAVAAAVIEAVGDVEGMDAAAAEVVVTAGLHSRCRVTEEGPVEAPAAVTGTPGSLLQ